MANMQAFRAFVAALIVAIPSTPMAACDLQSGPQTAALVELYTSEGCSSCPPADRRLGRLELGDKVVPLALHVGYWDDLGWRDPYAQEAFAQRQNWLVRLAGQSFVYTPQFFVAGTEVQPAALAARLRELNDQPARASIRLRARAQGEGLFVRAEVRSRVEGAAFYLAVAENGLSSQVRAGENGGRKLVHDHVVRVWIGPIDLEGGRVAFERNVPLAPGWQRPQLEVSAFVQDRRTGRVLQAAGCDANL